MIRYFAYYDENGELLNIGTVYTSGEVNGEITAEEYERLKAEIEANAPEIPEPVDPIDEALAILRGEVTE
jgi:hypothetical protein